MIGQSPTMDDGWLLMIEAIASHEEWQAAHEKAVAAHEQWLAAHEKAIAKHRCGIMRAERKRRAAAIAIIDEKITQLAAAQLVTEENCSAICKTGAAGTDTGNFCEHGEQHGCRVK